MISFLQRSYHLFFLCGCFLSAIPLCGQHTMSIDPGDTVHLDIDTWRGDLQWQVSHDNVNWDHLAERTNDTLAYVPDLFPVYFRAQITEGTCLPRYTGTIEVTATAIVLPTVTTTQPGNPGMTTAGTGGNITHTGGAAITARGVVYGTAPNPHLDDDPFTTDGTGNGSFTSLLTSLTPNTTYYVRSYATNSEGTSYGNEYSFTTLEETTYAIGDEGPAGGTIFYDKGFYSDGWRYLEAAPADWYGSNDPWVDLDWGCYDITINGTSTDIGTGKENTDIILANGCAEPDTPVRLAATSEAGGYTDWFLPSRDELNAMYTNLWNLGGASFHSTYGFHTLTYTSSSVSGLNDVSAWGYDFAGGGNIQHLRIMATISARPARRF